MSWEFPASRAVAFGPRSRCVHGSPAVSSCARTYSGQRPRSWTRPGGAFGRIARGREAEAGGSPNRLLLDSDGPPSPAKSPSGSQKITGGSRVWPTHGPRGPRPGENHADIGVSLWTDHAGQQPADAWSAAWAAECNERPRINQLPIGRCAPVSADLLLTWDVPAVDLSYTLRDGADNGERSKGPVTSAVLMTQPSVKGQLQPPLNRGHVPGGGV